MEPFSTFAIKVNCETVRCRVSIGRISEQHSDVHHIILRRHIPHNTSPWISFTLALQAEDFCLSFSSSPSVTSGAVTDAGASKRRILKIFLTMYSRSFGVSSVRECACGFFRHEGFRMTLGSLPTPIPIRTISPLPIEDMTWPSTLRVYQQHRILNEQVLRNHALDARPV